MKPSFVTDSGIRGYVGKSPLGGAALMRCDSKADFERVVRAAFRMNGWKEDAGLTAAYARSLEHIMAKTYAAEYAQYRAHEFFPVSTEVGPGDLTFTYRMIDRKGNAKVITAGMGKDLPNIDLGGEEWPAPIITLGASYEFTVIDQQSGAKMQFAIEAEKAKATRESIEALEESIWCTGYAGTGVSGVTNAPGVAAVTQVSTGTWASQIVTALATAPSTSVPYPAVGAVSAIASDIIAMKQAIFSKTLGRHNATNCLLPPNLYSFLDTLPRSPAFTDDTALAYLEKVTGLDIDYWPILQNAGALNGSPATLGGSPALKTRVVVYEKDPDVVQLIQAQPFVQLAPQPTGLVWSIPTYSRIGGAMCVRPLGIVYMDGL
jgi:hypothetical protein